MEESGKKQLDSSSSSSSFANDLFDSKDSSSLTAVFGSIFDSSSKDTGDKNQGTQHDPLSGRAENSSQGSDYKSLDSIFEKEVQQSFNYSSSIYYGGQDNYSDPQTTKSSTSVTTYKKDGEQDDPNTASRGNWWQGSLYY